MPHSYLTPKTSRINQCIFLPLSSVIKTLKLPYDFTALHSNIHVQENKVSKHTISVLNLLFLVSLFLKVNNSESEKMQTQRSVVIVVARQQRINVSGRRKEAAASLGNLH